ncbi:BgTH12-03765, partial [Blumeria graminis f. sp. triticale]
PPSPLHLAPPLYIHLSCLPSIHRFQSYSKTPPTYQSLSIPLLFSPPSPLTLSLALRTDHSTIVRRHLLLT